MFKTSLALMLIGLRELSVVTVFGGLILYRKQGFRFWISFVARGLLAYCFAFLVIRTLVTGHDIGVIFTSEILGCGWAVFRGGESWIPCQTQKSPCESQSA